MHAKPAALHIIFIHKVLRLGQQLFQLYRIFRLSDNCVDMPAALGNHKCLQRILYAAVQLVGGDVALKFGRLAGKFRPEFRFARHKYQHRLCLAQGVVHLSLGRVVKNFVLLAQQPVQKALLHLQKRQPKLHRQVEPPLLQDFLRVGHGYLAQVAQPVHLLVITVPPIGISAPGNAVGGQGGLLF